MLIAVAIDSDGHFQMARLSDREEALNVLKSVSDGDYFENEKEEDPDPYWDEETFEEYMLQFSQRGTFDILEL